MGRQVRFFNFPVDLPPFEEFLSANQAAIIHATAPTPEPVQLPTLRRSLDDPELFCTLLIVRQADLPQVRWRHIRARNLWIVDNASPVVEYRQGYNRDGQPLFLTSGQAHGRMWFQTSRWEEDELVHANPEFVAWADRLFRWIKKHWMLIESDYFSPAAAAVWNATWQIVLDEPCVGTAGDHVARWRKLNDPDNLLPNDSVHIAVGNATRDQPRRLTIAIRAGTDFEQHPKGS